jgi:hypothetical protein
MPILYPGNLDILTNPSSSDQMNDVGVFGDVVVSNLNDIAEALEALVGANARASDHLDYVRLHDGVNRGLYVPVASLIAPNPILNPGFDIWQDGTSFPALGVGLAWGPDGWAYFCDVGGTGIVTMTQSSDVPTVAQAHRSTTSLFIDVTTADATIAAGEIYYVTHRVEGFNWQRFDQKVWSLRFWVKGSKTGRHYVSARNGGVDRSCVVGYTINAANTWEEKQVTFPANPSSGTWNFTTGRGIDINWILAAGSTYQTTPDAWVTGNYLCASDQVNEMDSAANSFALALIGPPTLGTNALPYRAPDYQTELLRAKRYNEPVSATAGNEVMAQGAWYAATTAWYTIPLVPKRAVPTLGTVSAAGTFNALTAIAGVAAVTTAPATFLAQSPVRAMLTATCSGAAATAGQGSALLSASSSARVQVMSRIP